MIRVGGGAFYCLRLQTLSPVITSYRKRTLCLRDCSPLLLLPESCRVRLRRSERYVIGESPKFYSGRCHLTSLSNSDRLRIERPES